MTGLPTIGPIHKSAEVSQDGKYRYYLGREWGKGTFTTWIMLNPSTADAEFDDPTIRRCISFSRKWDTNGMFVFNLYALRATNPKDIKHAMDPVGPKNDEYLRGWLTFVAEIRETTGRPQLPVVVAWGNNASTTRADFVRDWANRLDIELSCLGHTKSRMPLHPLYQPSYTELRRWP